MSDLMKKEGIVLEIPVKSEVGLEYLDTVGEAIISHRKLLEVALTQSLSRIAIFAEVVERLIETLRSGHKVLVAGNGGSAAEAQHFAAELVGRFKHERSPYAVISLTTDTSILTAVANDYGYQDIFARQVQALGQAGDLLIVFSTSGESENLLCAARSAQQRSMPVIAITGDQPNRLECLADLTVHVPAIDTAITQELHMMVTHILCEIVESELMGFEGDASL
jgi:D-sedoheptulose 7-phosphate isomerase